MLSCRFPLLPLSRPPHQHPLPPLPPEPDLPASPTISGNGNAVEVVNLNSGRYLATASITDDCKGSDCNQNFAINLQSVFGNDGDQSYISRHITRGTFTFHVNVGDSNNQPEQRDLLKGKQLVTITADGAWSIDFDFQGSTPGFPTSATISGTGDAQDFLYLNPGIYLGSVSIKDNCEGSDCLQLFAMQMESVHGAGHRGHTEYHPNVTEGTFSFRLEVSDKRLNYLDGDLYQGKQTLTITAKGSWAIRFVHQEFTPALTDNPTISGTGYVQDFVTLNPGRYIVTVSINDKCEEPDCSQPFTIHMENLPRGSLYSEYLHITEGVSRFLLHVHDGSTSQGDIYKGKQILTIVTQGSWTIDFDLHKPAPVPPTGLTISGNGDYSDIVTIGPGRYIVTVSITDDCRDSNCDRRFGFTAQSVFGYDHYIRTGWSATEASFAFLLSVQASSATSPWGDFYWPLDEYRDLYWELYEGPQIFNVSAQGPWTITFSLQDPTFTTATNSTIAGTGDSFDIVNLEPGRYLVTASITDNCQYSICDQFFGFNIHSVFGNSLDLISNGQSITEGILPSLITVGNSNSMDHERDILEGKQLITVRAYGSWTISFERQ